LPQLLSLNDVSLTYYTLSDETKALENVSFNVKQGEFLSVVGPSGCGKTTLLSLICGIISPTTGSISLKQNCKVGYMLQKDHLFEWRSIFRNIMLGPEIQHRNNDEYKAYATELMKKYGLYEFRNSFARRLSGGMRQRAALIRTLVMKPDLLLLDEPFSALDFQTRISVCDDVYSIIRKENKTALLVTHDISEAISMSDRIVVLSARPASVRYVYETGFDKSQTPLMRREHPSFPAIFAKIHHAINEPLSKKALLSDKSEITENYSEATQNYAESSLPEDIPEHNPIHHDKEDFL